MGFNVSYWMVGVSKESTPNMSACTACKWISSLPVFWRNAFIKGPQVRSGIGLWVIWPMGDLAHRAGAWLRIVGCSDQASDSGILWLSSIYCSLYPLGPSILDCVLLCITGGTAQTPPSSSVSDEWMKHKMRLSTPTLCRHFSLPWLITCFRVTSIEHWRDH